MLDLSLTGLLRASPTLASRLPALERAARATSPILLLGEVGSGRTLLARAVHGASRRSRRPLIEVDPSTVPSTLFDSEFFGYKAGAFTGAESDNPGRIAWAEGGTLLIEHVEGLPLAAQPKLLRLLAEHSYAPLGGTERAANVRFIATGSEDLADRVVRGAFRRDLFHRLEVLSFTIPPLRQRKADLPGICDQMLADLSKRFGRKTPKLSRRARKWMEDYHWPGNLRQLRNLLERALILSSSAQIDPDPPRDASEARPRSLRELEREHILRTLAFTRGHQGQAAELLGISRKSLWEKRRRYDIP